MGNVFMVRRLSTLYLINIVRCHKPHSGAANFHSLDTRASENGGAVFKTGDPLGWFDY